MKKPNLVRKHLAEQIAETVGIEYKDAYIAVEKVFQIISNALVEGRDVQIRGFGTFKTVKRKARPVQDISRKKTILMPSRIEPTIRFSEYVKQQLR